MPDPTTPPASKPELDLDRLWVLYREYEGTFLGDTQRNVRRRRAKLEDALWENRKALLEEAREYRRLVGALLFLKGGRSPSVYIERALERGWKETQ